MTDTPDALSLMADLDNLVIHKDDRISFAAWQYKIIHDALVAGDAAIKRVAEMERENNRLARAWEAKHKAQSSDRDEARKMFDLAQTHAQRAERAEADLAAMRKAGGVPDTDYSAVTLHSRKCAKLKYMGADCDCGGVAAPQPPALDRDGEELMAQAIYENWAFHGDDPQKVAWVPGGNSNRQTEARALAAAAIRAMKGGNT